MQNTILREFEGHPDVVTTVLDQGGANGEVLSWVLTFWSNYFLRGFLLWDPDGSVGSQYGQPATGLPFGRGFLIGRDGRVVLPHFGHDPRLVIDAIYDLLGCTQPQVYCTAKATSLGTLPAIGWSGSASVGNDRLRVSVGAMLPKAPALVFRGPAADAKPFQGGLLCVQPPLVREPARLLDAQGRGEWEIDLSGKVPGAAEFFQVWGRDPGDPAGFGSSLSDALRVDYCL